METLRSILSKQNKEKILGIIAEVLLSRGQVERLCLEPIGGFTQEMETRLDQTFNQFLEPSSQLSSNTPFSALTAEVEPLTDLVNQKKQETTSYKDRLTAFYRDKQTTPSENLKISCKAHCSCGPAKVALSPTIQLERGVPFSRSSINLGLDITFNQSNTNRESEVEFSLSANKEHLEMGVKSSFSKTGFDHGYTAQVHDSNNLSVSLQVQNSSFQGLLHPLTVVDNGRLFFGCTLKRSRLGSNIRFPVLPFEEMKNFVSFDCDQTDSDSDSLPSKSQDKLEFVSRQKESEADFSLAEVQQESTERENLDIEKKEVPTFVEKRDSKQAYQVAMSTFPPQLSSVRTTPTIPEWSIFAVLLGLRVLVYIFELFLQV